MESKPCQSCQKHTLNAKFCSRSCAAVVNNSKFVKRKNDNKCSSCLCKIRPRRKFCDECFLENCSAKDMKLKDAIYERHHKSSAYALVRARARMTSKAKETKYCENCGWDKHVEVCHKIPISSFSEDTMLSEINAESNLFILCPNCHWLFDHGMIALSS